MQPSLPPSFLDPRSLAEYVDGIRRLARGLVAGDDAADEVVQETMLVALQHAPKDPARPGAWLAGVARNVARNLRRGARRREARERAAARPEAAESPLGIAARLEEHREVLAHTRDLEEPYRTTVFLRYFEDLSPMEIAARLSLPVATVKTRLRRGLEKLRTRLDDEHGGRRDSWVVALLPLATSSDAPPRLGRIPLAIACTAGVLALGGFAVHRFADSSDSSIVTSARESGRDLARSATAPTSRTPSSPGLAAAPSREKSPAAGRAGATADASKSEFVVSVDFSAVGGPVATTVRIRGENGALLAVPVDGDGLARFARLVPGAYVTWAESDASVTSYEWDFRIPLEGSEAPRLAMRRSTSLDGRVLDAVTHLPIEGARVDVAATDEAPSAPSWRALTDARGAFRIPCVPAEPARFVSALQIAAIAQGHAISRRPLAFRTASRSTPYEVEIALPRGADASGRVIDAHGRPVAGAIVHAVADPMFLGAPTPRRLRPFRDDDSPACRAVVGVTEISLQEDTQHREPGDEAPPPCFTRTDAEGRFRLDGLVFGTRYALRASRTRREVTSWTDVTPSESEPLPETTLRFDGETTVRFHVVDGEGRPVAGLSTKYREGESPAPGLLVVSRVKAGHEEADVLAPGFARKHVTFDAVADVVADVDVRLEPETLIRGTVVDQRGMPLAGAYVGYISGFHVLHSQVLEDEHVETGSDGTFSIAGLAAGSYYLYLRDDNDRLHQLVVKTPGDPVRVTSPTKAAGSLVVEVRLPDDMPVPSEVEVGVRTKRSLSRGRLHDCLRRYLADTWGRFGFMKSTEFGTGRLEFAVDGTEDEVVVVAPALVPAYVAIGEKRDAVVSVRLERGLSLRGRIVDAADHPVAHGCAGLSSFPIDGRIGRTDADGRFQIDCIPAGTATLVAYAPGYLVREVEARVALGAPEVVIALERAVALDGGLRGAKRGFEDDPHVAVYPEEQAPAEPVEAMDTGQMQRFRFDLAPGRYRVVVTQGDLSAEEHVELSSGRDRTLDLELKPAAR